MKRIALVFAVLSIAMFACSISSPTPTSAPVTAPATVAPGVTETPSPTEPPAFQPNVTCNKVSLLLDPALGSGATCKTVPENPSGPDMPPFAVNPEYTEITFQGYVLQGRFHEPHLDIFPVQSYSQLLPDTLPGLVSTLQSLIAGAAPGASALPFPPIFEAAQELHVQYGVVPFANGSGIRYLTQYTQFTDPINNHELFYTFQGLTADGKYWVSAVLPITNPVLPETGDNPPGGQSWDQFSQVFDTYISDTTTQLNAQAPASFAPSVPALDALIASIHIQP